MVNSPTMENLHQLENVVGYPFMLHQVNHNNQLLIEALVINDAIRRLIQKNAQVFSQIVANLERLKVQDNAHLFLRTRNNITAILNSMSGMPGIMSQMPPLPATINEDLVTTILPNTSQAFMFNSPTGISVKQEPRC